MNWIFIKKFVKVIRESEVNCCVIEVNKMRYLVEEWVFWCEDYCCEIVKFCC